MPTKSDVAYICRVESEDRSDDDTFDEQKIIIRAYNAVTDSPVDFCASAFDTLNRLASQATVKSATKGTVADLPTTDEMLIDPVAPAANITAADPTAVNSATPCDDDSSSSSSSGSGSSDSESSESGSEASVRVPREKLKVVRRPLQPTRRLDERERNFECEPPRKKLKIVRRPPQQSSKSDVQDRDLQHVRAMLKEVVGDLLAESETRIKDTVTATGCRIISSYERIKDRKSVV